MPPKKLCLTTTFFLVFLFYVVLYIQIINPEASVAGWGYNTTRDTSQYIVSNNLTAHILPEHFCDYETFLLVMVCSGPSNFEARNAIRETWGQEKSILGNNVSLFFLIGETANSSIQYDIMVESERFGDVIQERFIDSYNNLTLKSVVMLKLVSSNCANSSKYLFKIDDDMFVNMHLIVEMLVTRNRSGNLLMGRLICGAKPIKDASSKWYSPQYMYPGKVYPNYLSGTGYIISVDVAGKLYKTALKTPIFHLEDVYLTGICAKKSRIKPRNNPLFTYQKFKDDPCLLTKLYTAHRFSPVDIRRTYATLKDGNLTRECAMQKNSFNHWLKSSLLPASKAKRKSKCE